MNKFYALPPLRPLTIAYVGDSANVLHDMLVTYPRMGHKLRIASPEDEKYRAPKAVWDRVVELECDKDIWWGKDPKEAVQGADVVVTDTWQVVYLCVLALPFLRHRRISMGQEAEKEERLKAFHGYQITEELCREGGANPDWKFMHCLPRKQHEVDDEVCRDPVLVMIDSWFLHPGLLWAAFPCIPRGRQPQVDHNGTI